MHGQLKCSKFSNCVQSKLNCEIYLAHWIANTVSLTVCIAHWIANTVSLTVCIAHWIANTVSLTVCMANWVLPLYSKTAHLFYILYNVHCTVYSNSAVFFKQRNFSWLLYKIYVHSAFYICLKGQCHMIFYIFLLKRFYP